MTGAKVLRVTIRYRPLYKCSGTGCTQEELGDKVVLELDHLPDVSRLGSPPSAMPLGWASYSGGKFRCPGCVK